MEQNFFVAGGTLRRDANCYVERQADAELLRFLSDGEFCYVLTSRQMGKSSLMVRTISKLSHRSVDAVALDLTSVGQLVTPEQWYNGMLSQLGNRVQLEDPLQTYWFERERLSPVQRLFDSIRDVILPHRSSPLVIFIDEIDAVRSLPFPADEFFQAIRECYNRRGVDKEYCRLTFCLLGVATPLELIRDDRALFNIGRRIELADFTWSEVTPLLEKLSPQNATGEALLERIFHWTNGHPYLTQRLCREVVESAHQGAACTLELIDQLCRHLFLSPAGREQDSNLVFVRERLLHCEADLTKLLCLYEEILQGKQVADDEVNELFKQLRISGVAKDAGGFLQVRNRIYARVFDQEWIDRHLPDAQLERSNGERLRISATYTIGRAAGNDLVLADRKVSRRHALIQVQRQYQFWLVDLGSSNGTYLNNRRIHQPVVLKDGDQIELGPFHLVFRQAPAPIATSEPSTTNVTRLSS